MSCAILVTGATGATGRASVHELRSRGITVRAFVHKIDSRSEQLSKLGAEVVEGTSSISARSVPPLRASKGLASSFPSCPESFKQPATLLRLPAKFSWKQW